ncbi:hypothetical protein EDC01DRAFT_636813 [Geopyxis carbonaria]|nr:hypothetical protein EDC01DRAFT_636813 [Geopyxis carbonaria]
MADPVSIAASIVGLLSAASKITEVLCNLTTGVLDAPFVARSVMNEMNDLRLIFEQIQTFILNREGNIERIDMKHLVITLTACVIPFSELEDIVGYCETSGVLSGWRSMSLGDRLKWRKKKTNIKHLLEDLNRSKMSLNLMLNLLHCESEAEATKEIQELSRVLALVCDSQSIKNIMNMGEPLSSPDGFESELRKSRPYQGERVWSSSQSSVASSITLSSRLLQLSESPNLSEISNLSAFSLPIYDSTLSNAIHYPQRYSDDEIISMVESNYSKDSVIFDTLNTPKASDCEANHETPYQLSLDLGNYDITGEDELYSEMMPAPRFIEKLSSFEANIYSRTMPVPRLEGLSLPKKSSLLEPETFTEIQASAAVHIAWALIYDSPELQELQDPELPFHTRDSFSVVGRTLAFNYTKRRISIAIPNENENTQKIEIFIRVKKEETTTKICMEHISLPTPLEHEQAKLDGNICNINLIHYLGDKSYQKLIQLSMSTKCLKEVLVLTRETDSGLIGFILASVRYGIERLYKIKTIRNSCVYIDSLNTIVRTLAISSIYEHLCHTPLCNIASMVSILNLTIPALQQRLILLCALSNRICADEQRPYSSIVAFRNMVVAEERLLFSNTPLNSLLTLTQQTEKLHRQAPVIYPHSFQAIKSIPAAQEISLADELIYFQEILQELYVDGMGHFYIYVVSNNTSPPPVLRKETGTLVVPFDNREYIHTKEHPGEEAVNSTQCDSGYCTNDNSSIHDDYGSSLRLFPDFDQSFDEVENKEESPAQPDQREPESV